MTQAVALAPIARQQFLDSNGNPLVGAKLFTYVAGTNTKQDTYTDSTGTVANTNPILLDSSGRAPYGVWLKEAYYKFVFAPATDTDPPTSPIFTEDNLIAVTPSLVEAETSQWIASNLTPTYLSATSFSVVGDVTTSFEVGRRVKATIAAGFVYGTILSSSYAVGVTTVTLRNDSTVLNNTLSAVAYSVLTFTNPAIPNVYNPVIFGKNLIINPIFSINQREVTGTVTLVANAVGLDRWKGGSGGCTFTFATVNGLTTVTITAGTLVQVIEDINVPHGVNTHCLSWTGTAQGRINGGSYGTSGITASITGGNNVTVEFGTGTLTAVQFEKSTFPTAFEQRFKQIELDLCMRYYERIAPYSAVAMAAGVGVMNTTTQANIPVFFKVAKRAIGNVFISASTWNVFANGILQAVASPTSINTTHKGFICIAPITTPCTINTVAILQSNTSNAAYIYCDAEL